MSFICFHPIYQERVWGGRQLEKFYQRPLLPKRKIGESWELVDRPEAQSWVSCGEFKGLSLHTLWTQNRESIFGKTSPCTQHFPLLIKLLDAQEKLSLQVHPTPQAAQILGSESKTEAWYFIETEPKAEIYLGFKKELSESELLQKVRDQNLTKELNCYYPKSGDVAWVPAGCVHAIGKGNLILEVQQNSDTTYRFFDWNRITPSGQLRELHLKEAIQSLSYLPKPLPPHPLKLEPLNCDFFSLEEEVITQACCWKNRGESFIFLFVKEGALQWNDMILQKGEFGLIPAFHSFIELKSLQPETIVIKMQWGH